MGNVTEFAGEEAGSGTPCCAVLPLLLPLLLHPHPSLTLPALSPSPSCMPSTSLPFLPSLYPPLLPHMPEHNLLLQRLTSLLPPHRHHPPSPPFLSPPSHSLPLFPCTGPAAAGPDEPATTSPLLSICPPFFSTPSRCPPLFPMYRTCCCSVLQACYPAAWSRAPAWRCCRT